MHISSRKISARCWAWTGRSSRLPLPLGISFFTFQKIAFLVDTYIGGVVSFDLLHYSLFVTFFPQLIAGPIVRHNEIIPQFRHLPRAPRASDFAIGGSIFAIGLFKKVCLADLSAPWVNPVFAGRCIRRTRQFRRRLDCGARLFLPALFRLLRLHGHGDRAGSLVWHRAADQFLFALQIGEHHRFLAALAHFAFAVSARFHLHTARRKSPRRGTPLCQPDDSNVAWGTLARGGLDVRPMGRPCTA